MEDQQQIITDFFNNLTNKSFGEILFMGIVAILIHDYRPLGGAFVGGSVR